MSINESISTRIRELYTEKRFGVFSSIWRNQSHQTLVCFVVTEDLKFVLFATPRESRKFINSQLFEKVSFFVDSTHNDPTDLTKAITVAAVGKAYSGDKLSENKKDEFLKLYLKKHPYQEQFISSPSTQFVLLEVDHYQFVQNFQTVIEWSPSKKEDEILFRQIMGKRYSPGFLRGKVKIVAQESDLDTISSKDIVWVKHPNLMVRILDNKPGAIIVEENISEESLISEIKAKQIPFIGNLTELQKYIQANDEISVDGYLGFIILHEIR